MHTGEAEATESRFGRPSPIVRAAVYTAGKTVPIRTVSAYVLADALQAERVDPTGDEAGASRPGAGGRQAVGEGLMASAVGAAARRRRVGRHRRRRGTAARGAARRGATGRGRVTRTWTAPAVATAGRQDRCRQCQSHTELAQQHGSLLSIWGWPPEQSAGTLGDKRQTVSHDPHSEDMGHASTHCLSAREEEQRESSRCSSPAPKWPGEMGPRPFSRVLWLSRPINS
jgi:hypothetical protein